MEDYRRLEQRTFALSLIGFWLSLSAKPWDRGELSGSVWNQADMGAARSPF